MLPVRRGNPKAQVSGDACPWSDRLYAAFEKFTMSRVVILAQGRFGVLSLLDLLSNQRGCRSVATDSRRHWKLADKGEVEEQWYLKKINNS